MSELLPALTTASPGSLTVTTSWAAVVDAYLAAGVDSELTRRAYRRHLYGAFSMLGVQTVNEVSGAALAQLRATVTTSGLAPNTQAQALAAVRSFLQWSRLLGAHQLSADVVKTALKTPRGRGQ
jgi:site-specific recombinase XerC